jgi:predicted nucleic acid-binding protein
MAIASCLVDTNILLRITRRSDPQHKIVDTALSQLAGQGSTLHYTHQNIAELWNAMTRPAARNGLDGAEDANPQGSRPGRDRWATQRRFSELRRGHPPFAYSRANN